MSALERFVEPAIDWSYPGVVLPDGKVATGPVKVSVAVRIASLPAFATVDEAHAFSVSAAGVLSRHIAVGIALARDIERLPAFSDPAVLHKKAQEIAAAHMSGQVERPRKGRR